MTLGPFALRTLRGSAAELHARALPTPVRREVWRLEALRRALVLGSTQAPASVDGDALVAAGVELARRRSGGGSVLVVPGELVWFDVVVPIEDVRTVAGDDVSASMVWLGERVVGALTELGVNGATVHRVALVRTAWSPSVCFAGLGPGEVLDASGAKLVGISQRRTREAARFQCAVHVVWRPDAVAALLAPPVPTGADLGPVGTLAAATAAALPAAVADRA